MPKLSAIIVNYNTHDLLQKCLENLHGIYSNMEIIVVDNGSIDTSADMVASTFPDVVLIRTQNNGLAAGSNLGLQKATGDYLLYLGTDAFPEKDTISGMIDYMESNPEVGVATSKLVLRDGSLDMDAHRGFPTPWAAFTHFSKINRVFPKSRIFNQYFLGYKDLNEPHEIDLCISHFMLIRKEVFEKIGNWDEKFWLYGEDVDFCYRAKQSGYKIMYLPQWACLHYKGSTVGVRKETQDISKATPETKKRVREESVKAMRLFYEKHYKNKYPAFITAGVLIAINVMSQLRSKRS